MPFLSCHHPSKGSLSLWGFATSSDFFGYKLPSTFMRVDADSCGNIRPVDGEDRQNQVFLFFVWGGEG